VAMAVRTSIPARGSLNVNTEPRPGSLSSEMLPPCSSTSRRVSESPRPVALDLSSGRMVELIELVEDALVVFGGNADTGVATSRSGLRCRPSETQTFPTLRGELDWHCLRQVVEHLP